MCGDSSECSERIFVGNAECGHRSSCFLCLGARRALRLGKELLFPLRSLLFFPFFPSFLFLFPSSSSPPSFSIFFFPLPLLPAFFPLLFPFSFFFFPFSFLYSPHITPYFSFSCFFLLPLTSSPHLSSLPHIHKGQQSDCPTLPIAALKPNRGIFHYFQRQSEFP